MNDATCPIAPTAMRVHDGVFRERALASLRQ